MALGAAEYLARVGPADLFERLAVRPLAMPQASPPDDVGVAALAAGLLEAGAMNPAPALLGLDADPAWFGAVEAALRARHLRPRMFALASTPERLRALDDAHGVPFLGHLEALEGSVREAAQVQPLPPLFDAAFLAPALPSGIDPQRFVEGAARVLAHGGPLLTLAAPGDALGRDLHAAALERFHRADVRRVGARWLLDARR